MIVNDYLISKSTYHSRPLRILKVLFCGTSYTLWHMQTEQTVVKLSYNVLRRKEVIKHPPFPECLDIRPEY